MAGLIVMNLTKSTVLRCNWIFYRSEDIQFISKQKNGRRQVDVQNTKHEPIPSVQFLSFACWLMLVDM